MKQLLTAFFLVFILASCHDIKEPELKGIDKVKMGKLGLGQSTVVLHMKYFNPNHFKAKLKQAEGDAWIDSTYLGHFRVDSSITVPASSDFIVPVKLGVDMKFLLKNAISLFNSEEAFVRVSGTAKAGRKGFYKTFPLKYAGHQNLARLFQETGEE